MRVEVDKKTSDIVVEMSLKFHNVVRPVCIKISGEYFRNYGYFKFANEIAPQL